MGVVELILVIAGSAAAVVTVVAFVLVRRHPENAASGEVTKRPAGPGAESDT